MACEGEGVALRSVGLETMYRWRRGWRGGLSLARSAGVLGVGRSGRLLVVMQVLLLLIVVGGRGLHAQHARLGAVVLMNEIQVQRVG